MEVERRKTDIEMQLYNSNKEPGREESEEQNLNIKDENLDIEGVEYTEEDDEDVDPLSDLSKFDNPIEYFEVL